MTIRWETGPVRHPAKSRRQDTTHVWASGVDHEHIRRIRREPKVYAPSGPPHLVLEVLAYAAEEAEHSGYGKAIVILHSDRSGNSYHGNGGAGGVPATISSPRRRTASFLLLEVKM